MLLTSSCVKLTRLPRNDGSAPASRFPFRMRVCRAVKLPRLLGKVDTCVPWMYRLFSELMLPSDAGSGPPTAELLPASWSVNSAVKLLTLHGTVPDRPMSCKLTMMTEPLMHVTPVKVQ